ncbi:biotin-dependent carboxyltransferase family protein [Microlunatus sp. Y2014]|uniref:5-oxoprolinase subunit C family protein n=1 Tax=Microlunatus sp. Y2014 TaxID=3418488 RepID=UPI003DA75ED5
MINSNPSGVPESLVVEETGSHALIEDLGRPGRAHLGVPTSGAADKASLRLANRLVGNDADAAAVECLLGDLTVRVCGRRPVWLAVTGARTTVTVNGRPQASSSSLVAHPGDILRVEPPVDGARNYLAVRGGIDVRPQLGSRATDVLSGLGPGPIKVGDHLPIGAPGRGLPDTDVARVPPISRRLPIMLGPRDDWFTDGALERLVNGSWLVAPATDRVAVRLSGPQLPRRFDGQLPSEAILPGAIQVPPSGQPVIFGPDHPVTGGNPVVAVVVSGGVDVIGQLRSGDLVSFALVD